MSESKKPEVLLLKKGELEATVSTQGAWVDSLKAGDVQLLAPKRVTEAGKTRGGMHVCLPNFGPAHESLGLKRHGFGRELPWEVAAFDGAKTKLVLDTTKYPDSVSEVFRGLHATLQYELGRQEDSIVFRTLLTVVNNGNSLMPWAPAFHPYFQGFGAAGGNLIIDGDHDKSWVFSEGDFDPSRPLGSSTRYVQFVTNGVGVQMESSQLQQYVVWSDNPTEYICVEPTRELESLNMATLRPDYAPSAERSYSLTIAWTLPE